MQLAGSVEFESALGKSLAAFCIFASLSVGLGSVPVMRRIIQDGTTKDLPAVTYFTFFLSSTVWIFYGNLIGDKVQIIGSSINISLSFIYLVIFHCFSDRSKCLNLILLNIGTVGAFVGVFMLFHLQLVLELRITAVSLFFAFILSPLTSIVRVCRDRSCDSLPFELPFFMFLHGVAYSSYGFFVIDDKFTWCVSLCTVSIGLLQLFCHILFGNVYKSFIGMFTCQPSKVEEQAKDVEIIVVNPISNLNSQQIDFV